MTELKIPISEKLAIEMKKHPGIKWDRIANSAFEKCLQMLENENRKEDIKEIMKISEHCLKDFLENEPDVYIDNDLKKRDQ